MNNIYRYIRINVILALASFVLTSCKPECQVQNYEAHKESVQLNDAIYNRVFGSKSCSPHKLVLRVPVNSPIAVANKKISQQEYTPKITTIVKFSSEYNNFDISRIDKYANGWIYSKKDTCIAWKWSKNDKQKKLTLSLDRNLQIRDPNIKSVIFIVSLPVEMKEAEVDVTLKRYVWDKETSKVGAIHKIKMQKDYPNLQDILRHKKRGTLKTNDAFAFQEGNVVKNEIALDLTNIDKLGGVHIDDSLESLIHDQYEETYHDNPESPACEIPKDLKQS